ARPARHRRLPAAPGARRRAGRAAAHALPGLSPVPGLRAGAARQARRVARQNHPGGPGHRRPRRPAGADGRRPRPDPGGFAPGQHRGLPRAGRAVRPAPFERAGAYAARGELRPAAGRSRRRPAHDPGQRTGCRRHARSGSTPGTRRMAGNRRRPRAAQGRSQRPGRTAGRCRLAAAGPLAAGRAAALPREPAVLHPPWRAPPYVDGAPGGRRRMDPRHAPGRDRPLGPALCRSPRRAVPPGAVAMVQFLSLLEKRCV
ncbi:LOW QUALITY PROTEIN: hypothetical protein HMPREF0005_05837, partial [Achromobacter xylosoxidans C54]